MNHPAPSPLLNQALHTSVPQTLQEALELYQVVYMPSRNFSAKTRVNYSNDLTDLIGFLEQLGESRLDEISLRDLEAYLAELDRRGYAGTSRKRKTYSIKSLFRFLHESGYMTEDVAIRLIPPFHPTRGTRSLASSQRPSTLPYSGLAPITHATVRSSKCSCRPACAFPRLPG